MSTNHSAFDDASRKFTAARDGAKGGDFVKDYYEGMAYLANGLKELLDAIEDLNKSSRR